MPERFAWGEDYVCSVVPSLRYGTGRLKDDGAPPFLSAIRCQFFVCQRASAPKEIVTPIAAAAVASRSLTRPVPHRAASSPFHSSGGDDDVLSAHQRTAGGAFGKHQREGNSANPARTGGRAGDDGAHESRPGYANGGSLTAQMIGGSGAHPALLPPVSGHRQDHPDGYREPHCGSQNCHLRLPPSRDRARGEIQSCGRADDKNDAREGRRDKRGAGTPGCGGRLFAIFAYGICRCQPYEPTISALFSKSLCMAPFL